MPSTIQRSFAGGELAPALYARADQAKYQNGARTLRNFIVQRHGGAANRPGTRFRGEVKGSQVARVMKFVFNASQAYVIEAGEKYFRFYQNGAPILTSGVAAWSNATSYIVADLVTFGGVTYYCVAANLNQSPPNATFWYAQTGNIYEVPTPYAVADLFTLQYAQSADVVTYTHNLYPVQDLRRFGTTRWIMTPKVLAPTIASPTGMAASGSAGAVVSRYRVTAVATDGSEESLPGLEVAKAITGASQANPCQLTVVAHGYTTGDEVTIAGVLGMVQLNGLTATITVTGANTFQLVGINSTAFTAYTSGGTVSRTYARTTAAAPSTGAPIAVSWALVAGASEYNIYREINGAYGFIGVAQGTGFADLGYTPDFSNAGGSPPASRTLFAAPGDYPATVAYAKQRLIFGNTINKPEGIFASRIGAYGNFTSRVPLQADDPIVFSMTGSQINAVRNLIEVAERLVLLTGGAEFTLNGDANGVITPTAVNPGLQGQDGSSGLSPITIGASALFVQARGSIVRDLRYNFQDNGYTGTDLTVFSAHLLEGRTIVDWDYCTIPDSIVWIVRDDGVLLGLTYVREQAMIAWHRHDTDGFVESCTVAPDGSEDRLYLVVRRVIGGVTRRYLESLNSRVVTSVAVDAFFVDAGLSYDGRNTSGTGMTASLGTGWTVNDTQTLTASSAFFAAGDVGAAIVLKRLSTVATFDDVSQVWIPVGTVLDTVTLTIVAFTSTTVVTVRPSKNVPPAFQAAFTLTWSRAAKTVSGLSHLEGKTVSILGDGNVDPQQVVTGGAVTLAQPYSVVHVGLPYTSELEPLDPENLAGETLTDKQKRVNRVGLMVQASRGIFVSLSGTGPFFEAKQRSDEGYGEPTRLKTGLITVQLPGNWQDNARIRVRQTDPLPLTVLAIIPSGLIGG